MPKNGRVLGGSELVRVVMMAAGIADAVGRVLARRIVTHLPAPRASLRPAAGGRLQRDVADRGAARPVSEALTGG